MPGVRSTNWFTLANCGERYVCACVCMSFNWTKYTLSNAKCSIDFNGCWWWWCCCCLGLTIETFSTWFTLTIYCKFYFISNEFIAVHGCMVSRMPFVVNPIQWSSLSLIHRSISSSSGDVFVTRKIKLWIFGEYKISNNSICVSMYSTLRRTHLTKHGLNAQSNLVQNLFQIEPNRSLFRIHILSHCSESHVLRTIYGEQRTCTIRLVHTLHTHLMSG